MTHLKIFTAIAAMLLSSAAAHAQTPYQVSPGVSDGVLNIRQGPSAAYGLVGVIPAGAQVTVYRCVPPRNDGYSKADWCEVNYRGTRGWASTTGMMPLALGQCDEDQFQRGGKCYDSLGDIPGRTRGGAATSEWPATRGFPPIPPPPVAEVSIDWTCTPSVLVSPSDPNPVRSIRIRASGSTGTLRRISVIQTMLNGSQYERLDQYNVNTKLYSDANNNRFGWSGVWNKAADVEMFGEVSGASSNYTETQFKNGVKQFVISTACSQTH